HRNCFSGRKVRSFSTSACPTKPGWSPELTLVVARWSLHACLPHAYHTVAVYYACIRGRFMKKISVFCVAVLSAVNVLAQQQTAGTQDKNPVTSTIKQFVNRQKPNVIGAAELMPADKYTYKPTEQQMTFGHLIEHIAKSNYFLCEQIGGTKPTQQ